jgi:acetolactate synthase-1/2/3 large subunit
MKKTGAQIILEQLIHHGVDTLFGYPGGAIMPVYDALLDYSDKLTHYRLAHEQGVIHAADGYARTTGNPGICFVTSGPGATNTVTGIATAFLDSVPLVLFTGQVPSWLFGSDSFQEIDITSICEAITKKTFHVKDVTKLADIVSEALSISTSGRPGPVLVDLPKDIQTAIIDYSPKDHAIPGKNVDPLSAKLSEVLVAINNSWRPLIYAGGGVKMAKATDTLKAFAEKTGIPVTNSLMGLGTIPIPHPLALGLSGLHGHAEANEAITHCDLLIVAGARFSDRAIGTSSTYAKKATIVHLDIDDTEFSKNIDCHIYVKGDLKASLESLLYNIEERIHPDWLKWIESQKKASISPERYCPQNVVKIIDTMTPDETILVADTGQHQMWAAQNWQFKHANGLVTSGGLGTMGYGLGAAVGAQIANPETPVVLITGDGCFRMNSQELIAVAKYRLPITIILMNNNALGMVRQLQKLFNNRRFSEIDNQNPLDYVNLCKAYQIEGERITTLSELTAAMTRRQAVKGPYFIEVVVDSEEDVYPIVPAGKALNEYIDQP